MKGQAACFKGALLLWLLEKRAQRSDIHFLATQVLEETGLHIDDIDILHVSNCVHMEANKHYVTIIMSASVPKVNSVCQICLQPHYCRCMKICFEFAVQIKVMVYATSD